MQEFNKVSTTSNFIKQLLNTTYLPVVRTVQAGDYIVEGRDYLYKCEIIRCTGSGYISPYMDATLSPKATFIRIGEYTFGERNGKLCTIFQSNHEGYDSLTHERLGDYCRALRDMYGLNLMPLYNCFSKNSLGQYHVFEDRIVKTNYNYHTKVYKVPIRFNTDYTICMENVGKTTFAPAFIRHDNLVYLNKTAIGDNIDVTNRYISLHTNDVISTYSGLRFFDPIVIRFNNVPETRTVTYATDVNSYEYTGITTDIVQALHTYYKPVTPTYDEFINNLEKFVYVSNTGTYTVRMAEATDWDTSKIFYTSDVNPHERGWCHFSDGIYSVTPDTQIVPNKLWSDVSSQKYYVKSRIQNTATYTYNVDDVHCEMYDAIENIFYLLIQVPESFDSNIVILEGDYRNTQSDKYFNETDLRNYPENYLDKLFTHDIRLMRMNVPEVTPFSESLVQFLLWHAICGLDTINLDMDRLLASIRNLYMSVDDKYYANYWYFRYRELISRYSKHNQYEYIDDNLGYVTTEIEDLLNRRW